MKRLEQWKKNKPQKVLTPNEKRALELFADKVIDYFDEEETEFFVLNMYVRNETDLDYFQGEDKQKVRAILAGIAEDSKRHAALLEHIIQLCG